MTLRVFLGKKINDQKPLALRALFGFLSMMSMTLKSQLVTYATPITTKKNVPAVMLSASFPI